ncbi:hypothetical protein SLE2022_020720 [Rubroshorea leprosula]
MTFSCSHQPLEWTFSQVFGESSPGEEIQNVDIVSTLEFEKRGDYLAVGDQGGRVVIFERKDGKQTPNRYLSRNELEQFDSVTLQHPEYQYKMEFQSHEPEFDYLKSVEIEEKINKVKWCTVSNGSLFILSTNDKTIKLWKVKDRKVKKVKEMDLHQRIFSENTLLAERSFRSEQHELHAKIDNNEDTAYARCRKVYGQAHDFNVNSISYNSDGETFLSADDLRINLWNLEINNQCFNIIDMKPSNMEDLTEVITSAEFHPNHCNLLAYSSSRGFIRLVDMRQSALCDDNARIMKDTECTAPRSFFTEIVAAISDVKFSSDGQHILSRDYMNLKLWDTRKGSSPIAIFNIHEHLRPKLCDLYDKDSIFDKFECCFSGDGIHFATGSYSNLLHVFSHGNGSEKGITIEASKIPDRKPPLQTTLKSRRSSLSNLTRRFHRQGHENTSLSSNDFLGNLSCKLQHLAWHPTTNLIAFASRNSLFLYHA